MESGLNLTMLFRAGSYSTNLHSSDYKVILLNNVAVGNTYEAYYNKPTLVCPPWGYDSVRQLHFSGELG